MAHVTELARLGVARVFRIVDGFGRPDPNVAITTSGRKAFAIRRNMTAVHLKVLLLAAVAQPRGLNDVHVGSARRMGFGGDGEMMKCGQDASCQRVGSSPWRATTRNAKCEVVGAAARVCWSKSHTYFFLGLPYLHTLGT